MNLTFFGLCLACMGVSLAEGFLMANLFKSASRQPEIIGQLRTLMIMGIAFIEGTFFVTLAMSFIIKLEKEVEFVGRKCKSNHHFRSGDL